MNSKESILSWKLESKDHYGKKKENCRTAKKQAKLFHFAGFQKKDSNGNEEAKFKFHCRFCGSGCKQNGARKSHENWCKENPDRLKNSGASNNCNFGDLNQENLTEIVQDEKSDSMAIKDILLPIINEISDKACESGAAGGWNSRSVTASTSPED